MKAGDELQVRIEISAGIEGGATVYAVTDNGVGFDPGDANRLFEPFTRLHDARRFEGLGIGLSLVQRIVERHGGQVWAEGEPGAGSEFFFTLGPPPAS